MEPHQFYPIQCVFSSLQPNCVNWKKWCSLLPRPARCQSLKHTPHLPLLRLALLSRGSGSLCHVLWRTVSFPERSKWPRLRRTLPLRLLFWLRAFFPGSKELSFPLVHADPGGLSNLLAKCLYFYSCLWECILDGHLHHLMFVSLPAILVNA